MLVTCIPAAERQRSYRHYFAITLYDAAAAAVVSYASFTTLRAVIRLVERECYRPSPYFLNLDRIQYQGRLIRVCLQEHENHHTGDRNVEPNGEGQTCDSAVHREPARQREEERRQHHGQSDDGEDYVAG
jgi:hypothetical protein